jgi:hypothetical protein
VKARIAGVVRTKAYPPVIVACAMLAAPASASASTELFTVSGTYLDGTLSGTFDYNAGVFSNLNITATGWVTGSPPSVVFNVDNGSTPTSINVHSSSVSLAFLTLLPAASLATIAPGGSTTFGANFTSHVCFGGAGCNEFPVGTLTASSVSAVPLPGSLPLFASGLGAMGLLRWLRKKRAA